MLIQTLQTSTIGKIYFRILVCFFLPFTLAFGQPSQTSRYESVLRTKVAFEEAELSLPQVLQYLHKEQRLNFVVSGVAKLKTAKIKAAQTIEEVLDAIASAFDYRWTIDKRGIILFIKGFEQSNDFPQISLSAVRQLTADTLSVFQTVSQSDRSWIDEVQQLAKTITPDQWLLLKSGQSLPAQSLNAVQWNHIQQAGLANQVADEKRRWQTLSTLLAQLDETRLVARPIKYEGMDEGVLPFRLLLISKNSEKRPLYEFRMTESTNLKGRSDKLSDASLRIQDKADLEEARGTENPEGISGRWSRLVTLSQEQISLGELLRQLSVSNELEYTVDNGLGARLVQVYCANVTKRALTDGISELEDWHWMESKPGKARFTRRTLKDIGEIGAIPRRIQATLPRDLRDFLGARRPALTAGEWQPTFVFDPRQRKNSKFDERKGSLRDYGIRGLITKLTSQNVGEEGIAVAKLSADDRRLLVTALLGETFDYMQYRLYGGDFPLYIYAPQSAELALSGDNLQILAKYRDATRETMTGFGAPIPKDISANFLAVPSMP